MAVTGIPEVPLMLAADAEQLSRPLVMMAYPRYRNYPSGNGNDPETQEPVSYTHLRAHET